MSSKFVDLGVGVGLRPAHHKDFLLKVPKSISWVEVVSENFLSWKRNGYPKVLDTLLKVRREVPVAMHGVSLNIASTDPVDFEYLKSLKDLFSVVNPFIISDHIAWTGVNSKNLHDLLPIPYTRDSLKLISEKVDQVQNFFGRRILLENPSSYFEYKDSEMSESEFIIELLKVSDCGVLLDVNNVYVSSVNHGFDAKTYLKNIPAHRIGQIHLAGHSNQNGFLIDTHDAAICSEVWDLYRWVVENVVQMSTMVERDGKIPEWNVLEAEVLKIGEIQNECKQNLKRASESNSRIHTAEF